MHSQVQKHIHRNIFANFFTNSEQIVFENILSYMFFLKKAELLYLNRLKIYIVGQKKKEKKGGERENLSLNIYIRKIF